MSYDICEIVLSYYFIGICFDKYGECIEITGDCDNTLTVDKSKHPSLKWSSCTVYGDKWIDSMCGKTITCKFKVLQTNIESELVIGITSKDDSVDGDFRCELDTPWYGYCNAAFKVCNPSSILIYGTPFYANDTVTMVLDLSQKILSFEVNNKLQGIAFDDIVIGDDIQYKVVVCAWAHGDSISIIDYSIAMPSLF
eukprot:280260_1